ncbi:MAG: response regulator transcription factor [Chloroflexales bacterium]|nr:response regulator transcription factor [Chloroflexales bacterium]
MISICIVDDHQIFRDGLKLLFDNTADMQVIAEAQSGEDALEKLAELKPDLILMDIQLPDKNGIDVTRELKERNPAHKVLMLTMFEDDQSVFAAMRAGALGYVLKGINHEEMVQTVRIAAAGGAVFSPQIAERILQWFSQAGNQQSEATAVELSVLTQRERDVLELLAAGCDNNTIADRLTVTEKTVRNYVSQLLKKLEVSDRYAAAEKARRAGMNEL